MMNMPNLGSKERFGITFSVVNFNDEYVKSRFKRKAWNYI